MILAKPDQMGFGGECLAERPFGVKVETTSNADQVETLPTGAADEPSAGPGSAKREAADASIETWGETPLLIIGAMANSLVDGTRGREVRPPPP
jgi:hypothetical protein